MIGSARRGGWRAGARIVEQAMIDKRVKDAAEMESWLRGEGQNNASAFAMMKKIGELSKALGKFNAATDVMIEMNDIGTLVDSLPDAGDLFGWDGQKGSSERYEDKYIEYFLQH